MEVSKSMDNVLAGVVIDVCNQSQNFGDKKMTVVAYNLYNLLQKALTLTTIVHLLSLMRTSVRGARERRDVTTWCLWIPKQREH